MAFRAKRAYDRRRRSRLACSRAGRATLAAALLVSFGLVVAGEQASADDGEALFAMACATCHLGGGGLLGGPRTPDLFVDPLPRGADAAALRRTLLSGILPPRMPSFVDGLAPDEIDAIVAYVLVRRAESGAAR